MLVQMSIILNLEVKLPTYFPLDMQKQLLPSSTAELAPLLLMTGLIIELLTKGLRPRQGEKRN